MSEFASSWLDLREAADARARDVNLVTSLSTALNQSKEIRLIDLGAGTGSLCRYLAPTLRANQTWHLLDYSSSLLEEAEARFMTWAAQNELTVKSKAGIWCASNGVTEYRIATEVWDFANGLGSFPTSLSPDVITASAFLDLVSLSWIEQLVAFCKKLRTSFYGSLTYNGTMEWNPGNPSDSELLRFLNDDQQRDKGMGIALGANSSQAISKSFASSGFLVKTGPSPWCLTPTDSQLQKALLLQCVKLLEQKSNWPRCKIREWSNFRLAAIVAGQSQLKVGHQDIWAVPADRV